MPSGREDLIENDLAKERGQHLSPDAYRTGVVNKPTDGSGGGGADKPSLPSGREDLIENDLAKERGQHLSPDAYRTGVVNKPTDGSGGGGEDKPSLPSGREDLIENDLAKERGQHLSPDAYRTGTVQPDDPDASDAPLPRRRPTHDDNPDTPKVSDLEKAQRRIKDAARNEAAAARVMLAPESTSTPGARTSRKGAAAAPPRSVPGAFAVAPGNQSAPRTKGLELAAPVSREAEASDVATRVQAERTKHAGAASASYGSNSASQDRMAAENRKNARKISLAPPSEPPDLRSLGESLDDPSLASQSGNEQRNAVTTRMQSRIQGEHLKERIELAQAPAYDEAPPPPREVRPHLSLRQNQQRPPSFVAGTMQQHGEVQNVPPLAHVEENQPSSFREEPPPPPPMSSPGLVQTSSGHPNQQAVTSAYRLHDEAIVVTNITTDEEKAELANKQAIRTRWICLGVLLVLVVGAAVGLGVGLSSSAPSPVAPLTPAPVTMVPSAPPSFSSSPTGTPSSSPTLTPWSTVGSALFGSNPAQRFGADVAIVDNIMAIGSPGFNSSTGFVRVVRADTGQPIGQDLFGEMMGDRYGHTLALSVVGSLIRVAVASERNMTYSSVQVYEFVDGNSTFWQPVGRVIDTPFLLAQIADTSRVLPMSDFAMSANGQVLAFAIGETVSYEFNGTDWIDRSVGLELVPDALVSLSRDGRYILIAGQGISNARIYQFAAGARQWLRLFGSIGNLDIIGQNPGFVLETASGGAAIAEGASAMVLGDVRGIVQAYRLDLSMQSWERLGGAIKITERAQVSSLPMDVAISADGMFVAVAFVIPLAPSTGPIVRVYRRDGDRGLASWIQVGQEITSSTLDETPATTISVAFTTTNNGQRLAVALGTPFFSGEQGRVDIYEL